MKQLDQPLDRNCLKDARPASKKVLEALNAAGLVLDGSDCEILTGTALTCLGRSVCCSDVVLLDLPFCDRDPTVYSVAEVLFVVSIDGAAHAGVLFWEICEPGSHEYRCRRGQRETSCHLVPAKHVLEACIYTKGKAGDISTVLIPPRHRR